MAKSQCDRPDASDLVMTQAELPPGIDAPTPKAEHDRILAGTEPPPDVERDIHQLAERVGGLDRLRDLIDGMCDGRC